MLLQVAKFGFYHRVVVRQQNYPNQKEVHQVYVLKFGKKLPILYLIKFKPIAFASDSEKYSGSTKSFNSSSLLLFSDEPSSFLLESPKLFPPKNGN